VMKPALRAVHFFLNSAGIFSIGIERHGARYLVRGPAGRTFAA
jgi:hypothetical protein